LILFRQETWYWTVLPKEVRLYHWLKNQRLYMREYEEYPKRKKENPFTRNSQYYDLLKIHVGIESYKSGGKKMDV
jgi:hypothetical protein